MAQGSDRRRRPSDGRPHGGSTNGHGGSRGRSGQVRGATVHDSRQRPGSSRGYRASRNPRRGSYHPQSNYRTIHGSDTGLNVRHHPIGFSGRESFWERMRRSGNIGLVLVLIVIVILIVLVLIVGSAVRGCTSRQAAEQQQAETASTKVASGLPSELSSELEARVDQDDKLAEIARTADQYPDSRLVELALNEPDAIDFVAGALAADGSNTEPYSGTVTAGEPPLLYDFDTNWGYMTYGDGMLGVTGSGPTTLSMAYMGLTGKTDQSPADIAAAAAEADAVSGDSQMSGDFVKSELRDLGLDVTEYEVSADTIASLAGDGRLMIVELKAGAMGDTAHWALLVGKNDDGSYKLYDPTSAVNSARSWALGTITANADQLYLASGGTAASSSGASDSGEASDSSSADSGSDSAGSSSSTASE